jgi:hypothetical protein
MTLMNQVVKFPDMRPPNPRPPIRAIPTPAEYRRTVPTFTSSDAGVGAERHRRKRLWKWFGVAVALHAALLLTLWLTPPMRLKWGPSPDAWVQVTSIPKPEPDAQKAAPDAQKTVPESAAAAPPKATTPSVKPKSRNTPPVRSP